MSSVATANIRIHYDLDLLCLVHISMGFDCKTEYQAEYILYQIYGFFFGAIRPGSQLDVFNPEASLEN